MTAEDVVVRKADDDARCLAIAAGLPDYFNATGLALLREDLAAGEVYGAFDGETLIGFAVFKAINSEAIELAWLAVERDRWSHGVGTRLVEVGLAGLAGEYRACQVKTLAATVEDEGYARTRRFYAGLGFIPLEVIDPYPGWEAGNPCQIMVRFLR